MIAVLVIALGAAGWYIYNDQRQAVSINTTATSTDSIATSTGGVTVVGDGGGTITVEESDEFATVTPKIPAPSLTAALVPNNTLSAEAKLILEKNIQTLRAELTTNPSLVDLWIKLGTHYKIYGDFNKARDAWVYAGALSPTNPVSFYNLADLYQYNLKNFALAEQQYKAAIAASPHNVISYLGLHDLYYHNYKTNTSLAADILLEGLAKNPNHPDLLVTLAAYYKAKGDTAAARTYYERALAEYTKVKNTKMIETIKLELDNL